MTKSEMWIARRRWSAYRRCLIGVVALLVTAIMASAAIAAADSETKSAGGLTVYLGIIPAEFVQGLPSHPTEQQPQHGGAERASHDHHIIVAIFDSSTGARIADATLTAKVSGLGSSGSQKTLEPMKIADAISYGAIFNLYPDIYTIMLTVQRPGSPPVVLDFDYDHRRP